jgi:hypothetical protein
MKIKRIEPAENGGDATLRQIRVAGHDLFFGDEGDFAELGDLECIGQAGNPASDNQKFRFKLHLSTL